LELYYSIRGAVLFEKGNCIIQGGELYYSRRGSVLYKEGSCIIQGRKVYYTRKVEANPDKRNELTGLLSLDYTMQRLFYANCCIMIPTSYSNILNYFNW